MIRHYGCYRAFGDAILLTDDDAEDLIRHLHRRGTDTPEPQDIDDGFVVFIGSKRDVTADVFVTWCRPGSVDRAIIQVSEVCPGNDLIDFSATTYGAYQEWLKKVASERQIGKWFLRTPKFNTEMQIMFPKGQNDNG